jgi:endonuclease YncB( thermonuclease family)
MYTVYMAKKKKKVWTRNRLISLGIPAILITGILLSIQLGLWPKQLERVQHYQHIKTIFPHEGIVRTVYYGDTFMLQNGVEVRLFGINAPGRGEDGEEKATSAMKAMVERKHVYLEYDRYQDDKYGRILVWVWVGCEDNPKFLPADYMHLTGNASKNGLIENPEGCKQGRLVNEELVKQGLVEITAYKDRGELKYEKRLKNIHK